MANTSLSVVLIVIDALRYDCVPFAPHSPHLAATGLSCPSLPVLTDLVRDAHQFTQAVACAPYTPAAFASMLTGLLPPETGIRAHAASSLAPDVCTLAAILGGAGYRTCIMSDHLEVLAPVRLLRDFQVTVNDEESALAWWETWQDEPRFLLLHMWDIHKPYGMPTKHSLRGVYPAKVAEWHARLQAHNIEVPADLDQQPHPDPEVHQVDVMQCLWEQAFGWATGLQVYLDGVVTFDQGRLKELVEAGGKVRLFDDTLLIVTSDHGEGRCDDLPGRLNHSANLLDDTIRIPLFLRVPAAGPKRVITDQVSQADITPTILDILALTDRTTPGRTSHNGRSLLPLLHGHSLPQRPAYAEISRGRPAQGAAPPLDGDPPSVVHQRMLRYPQRKICLMGQLLHLDHEWLEAPAEMFVRRLYRDILGRFEGASGLAWWLEQLRDEGGTPDLARRRAIVRAFLESREGRHRPRYAIYDLQHDPLEEKPHTPQSDILFWHSYRPQADIMQEIDRAARLGGPLLSPGDDGDIVRKRLAALGYVEQ